MKRTDIFNNKIDYKNNEVKYVEFDKLEKEKLSKQNTRKN